MPTTKLNMPRLNVTISPIQSDWLIETAEATGNSLSALVREALSDLIRKYKGSEETDADRDAE